MINDFKSFFMRGLGALLPTLVTIALLLWIYNFVDTNIGQYITRGVVSLYVKAGVDPPMWLGIGVETALKYGDPIDEWDAQTGRRLTSHHKALSHPALQKDGTDGSVARVSRRQAMWELATRKWKFFNAIGFVIAILLIYFLGYFLASFIGRTTWRVVERLIHRIPLIGAIYPNIKQVTDFLVAEKKVEFSGVVAVQYPRKGIWSLGLVTGSAMESIVRADARELLTVFIPSSPTPVTGYTVTVSREDVIELPMSFDEALRYTISAGVLRPSDLPGGPKIMLASEG